MNYNDDWREDRRRHKENPNYNPRWDTREERQRSNDSGYWNDSDYDNRNMGRDERYNQRYESNWHGEQNIRRGRNPNWDQNAPNSSMYEGRNQFQNREESYGGYGDTYENWDNQNRPNQNYSGQGMSDPQYGNPRFSDRERRGTSDGASNRHERGNYGNYTDFRSSGQDFERAPQGRYGSHTQGWDDNEDYRNGVSLGRRDRSDFGSSSYGVSHRGKGPKGYKRDDNRIKEEINDALTDHHNLDASDIDVEIKDGNVILSGHVDSRQAKREAESAIDYISGVNNVENRLHVKSESTSRRSSGNMSSDSNSWMSSESKTASGSGSNASKTSDSETKSTTENSKTRNSKTSV